MDEKNRYIETVCDQIRWKRAQPVVRRELEDHLEDQIAEFAESGMPQEEAVCKTIASMGDPIEVGTSFDRIYRPKICWRLFIPIMLLALFGFVMQAVVMGKPLTWQDYLAAGLGIAAMIAAFFTDFSFLARRSWWIYGGYLTILFILSIMHYLYLRGGVDYLGSSYRYAELIISFFPVVYAIILYHVRGQGVKGIAKAMLAVLPFWILWRTSPSVMVVVQILFLAMSIYYLCMGYHGTGKKQARISGIGISALSLFIIYKQWVTQAFIQTIFWRIQTGTMGEYGRTYREVLSGAAWLGQGSSQWAEYLYNYNYTLVIINMIHQLGIIFFVVAMLLMFITVVQAVRMIWRQKACLARILAFGIVVSFVIQFILSVCHNLGYEFIWWGMMPFFSGKLSFIIHMFLTGMLLSTFHSGHLVLEKRKPLPANEE